LGKNSVLLDQLGPSLAEARRRHCLSGASVRVFAQFAYQTQKTWSQPRRVVGKAEVSVLGDNPRFVVTNLPVRGFKGEADGGRFIPARLYEEVTARAGKWEHAQAADAGFAGRSDEHPLPGQQPVAVVAGHLGLLLMERLRHAGLAGTDLAHADSGSVRLKLLKVAAQVRVSVRRVYVQLNTAYPWQELFRLCHKRLMELAPSG